MEEGLSLSGLPAGQKAKGRKISLPALPYSRPATLRSLLSVALSFARQFDCNPMAFFMPKMVSFSNSKRVRFRCQF